MDNQESVVTPGISLKCEGKEDDVGLIKTLNGDDESQPWTPLQMNEILHVILTFCDIPTLKKTRLVCKLWNVESIQVLYHKSYFTFPPNFYSKGEEEQTAEISHMQKFLKDHQIFLPNLQILIIQDCSTFGLFGEYGDNPCIGPFVKKLAYGIHDSVLPLEVLLHILTNLEVIDTRPDSSHKTITNLDFCLELMKVCARIKPRIITLTDFTMLSHLGEGRRCLDEISFYSRVDNVRFQNLLFSISPHPNYGSIPGFRKLQAKLSNILSVLLERSKNVMISFSVSGAEVYLKETIVPKMPRVENFQLFVYSPRRFQPSYSFPPDFQFSTHFPNMRDMYLTYGCGDNKLFPREEDKACDPTVWESYFASQKPATSVKTLGYCDSSYDLNLRPILRCFSQLEFLNFCFPANFSLAAQSIFTYGNNLRRINLEIRLQVLTSKISSFDAIFTGFSQQTVDKIKNSPKDWNINEMLREGMTLDDLRIQPSLFDLPHLEILSIKIHGDVSKYLPRKIFTVAGKYAFGLLPNLKVGISIVEKGRHEKLAMDALKEVSKLSNVYVD